LARRPEGWWRRTVAEQDDATPRMSFGPAWCASLRFDTVPPTPPAGGRRLLLSSRAPSSSRRWVQHVDVALESTCCVGLFQVFQMFHKYIAIISFVSCKSRSRCCICCNGCTRILQVFVPNVSSFFRCMLHKFHIYVIGVLSGCCVCVAMVF
jgi:hypothetical protein